MKRVGDSRLIGLEAVRQVIAFRGHPMVKSTHRNTIEVTTEEELTPRGDCIIGVESRIGCAQLDEGVKAALRREGASVRFAIRVGDESFSFSAKGDPGLQLSHPRDMVIRKSRFLSDRTLAVGATSAAKDLPRSLVAKLQDHRARGTLEIVVV